MRIWGSNSSHTRATLRGEQSIEVNGPWVPGLYHTALNCPPPDWPLAGKCISVSLKAFRYRDPPVFASLLYTTLLLQKTYICRFSLSKKKKIQRIFTFTKKRWNLKIAFSVCFAVAVTEAAPAPGSQSGTAKLHPWELPSAPQHQAARALNYEHLFFILIYYEHLLARCVPK